MSSTKNYYWNYILKFMGIKNTKNNHLKNNDTSWDEMWSSFESKETKKIIKKDNEGENDTCVY